MGFQTTPSKEIGGVRHNPDVQMLSSDATIQWLPFPLGSASAQVVRGESTTLSVDVGRKAPDFFHVIQDLGSDDQKAGVTEQHTLSFGHPVNQKKPQESDTHFELAFGQPSICAKRPGTNPSYSLFPCYEAQLTGRLMLPLNLTLNDGPIYVNAKQYHRIILRLKSRAQGNSLRVRKPYMHESRHLHAMRRARGCGGRFLNTKSTNRSNEMGKDANNSLLTKIEDEIIHPPLHEANPGSSPQMNRECLSIHSYPSRVDRANGDGMRSSWATGADGCCRNLTL